MLAIRNERSMMKELHNWSKIKAERKTNLVLRTERDRMRVVLPNAVLMKPVGQPTVRKNKFFTN